MQNFNKRKRGAMDVSETGPSAEDNIENSESSPKKKRAPNPKRGRIIVRNLSFKATEESVKDVFQKFGEVLEVNIPKKPDGKMFGFCFVQYKNMTPALKAVKEMKSQSFLGRPVAVDLSVPKATYQQIKGSSKEPEDTPTKEDSDSTPVKSLNSKRRNTKKGGNTKPQDKDSDDDSENDLGDESGMDSENDSEKDEGSEDEPENGSEDEGGSESSEEEPENGSEDGEVESDIQKRDVGKLKKKKNKWKGENETIIPKKVPEKKSDVGEGKTLFVRNLSFDTTKESLNDRFSEFGQLEYALVCIDRDTEHSKGTAFVKFKEKDCAMKCLEEAAKDDGLIVDGQKAIVNIAISQEQVKSRATERTKKAKDNRNLFLAREGLIQPGTHAAEGVSKKDLDIRTGLSVWKRKMLSINNMFISDKRLCVRNLPHTLRDDKKFGRIFLNAAGKGAKITEARIMRDMKNVDENGIAVSKGFGYVTFTEHEHALQALRNTNNNPGIFTKLSRPIVEFSLEDRVALNAKQKRLEKSQQRNKEILQEKKKKRKTKTPISEGNSARSEDSQSQTTPYMGTKSDPKKFKGLPFPSHFGPKVRHVKRGNPQANLKKQKAQNVSVQQQKKSSRAMKREGKAFGSMKPPTKKMKLNRDETKLQHLVSKYHTKHEGKKFTPKKTQKKWFAD